MDNLVEDPAVEHVTTGVEIANGSTLVTDKFVYLNLSKLWVNVRMRKDTDDFQAGATASAPVDGFTWIAVEREGKTNVKEDRWAVALSQEEGEQLVAALVTLTINGIHKATEKPGNSF